MQEIDLLSLLIGDIYDAALDPTLWEGVLGKAAAFVGGVAARWDALCGGCCVVRS